MMNRSKCKPCPACHGTGKSNELRCDRCDGYGSVALKVTMSRRQEIDFNQPIERTKLSGIDLL